MGTISDKKNTSPEESLLDLFRSIKKIDNPSWLPELQAEIRAEFDKLHEEIHQRNIKDYLDTLIPLKAISKHLGVGERTLHRLRLQNSISIISIGHKKFIRKSEIERFLEEHTIKHSK